MEYRRAVDRAMQRITRDSPEQLAKNLLIFTYQSPPVVEDIHSLFLTVSAPTSPASVATLNRFEKRLESSPIPQQILLPTVKGIFVAEEPQNDLEWLIASARNEEGIPVTVLGNAFRFIPNGEFSSTEWTFFLDIKGDFSFPLEKYRLTSSFGPRVNPVTGRYGIHRGMDLAAPTGTAVFATRRGRVSEIGNNAVYGIYITVEHADNWTSLYGHLSKVETEKGKTVASGELIGRVGSTGQSTGPHLHFELRKDGKALDPSSYLKR
jgi:murein DD-endopeptidase MepM/ murein hydrolase activator NlpD